MPAPQEERSARLTGLVTKLEEEARKRESELAEAKQQREESSRKPSSDTVLITDDRNDHIQLQPQTPYDHLILLNDHIISGTDPI